AHNLSNSFANRAKPTDRAIEPYTWPHAPPESADAAQTTAAIAAAAATPTPARRSAVAAALSVAPVVTMSSTRITGRPEAASAAPWRGATARLESAARRRWAGLSPTESGR